MGYLAQVTQIGTTTFVAYSKRLMLMSRTRLLVGWIGHADLVVMASELPDKLREQVWKAVNPRNLEIENPGPIKALLQQEQFDEVHLLSNFPAFVAELFTKWLGCDPVIHQVELKKPTDYTSVFRAADELLARILDRPDRRSTRQAVWFGT